MLLKLLQELVLLSLFVHHVLCGQFQIIDERPVDSVDTRPVDIEKAQYSIYDESYDPKIATRYRRNYGTPRRYDSYEQPNYYTNDRYDFYDEDLDYSYSVQYPQYSYKPYDQYSGNCEDCNDDRIYCGYQRYLANFRGDWYSYRENDAYDYRGEERYETDRQYRSAINKNVSRYEQYSLIKGGQTYPDYSTTLPKPKPKITGCCCEFNYKKLPKRKKCKFCKKYKRIEYRQLTDAQRKCFHSALRNMKQSGFYNYMANLHQSSASPYAHGGAAFLPWHREYLFRFEQFMAFFKSHGCELPGLPYWDSTLDQGLPNPSHSALFTDEFMGKIFGIIGPGDAEFVPAGGWSVSSDCSYINPFLFRNGINGALGQCLLFSDFDVSYVFSKKCFRDLTANTDPKFESDHGAVHGFVGGHMGAPSCATYDPIFWMHHAFVDCIWEEFRKEHQCSNIKTEYPSVICGDDVGTPPWPLSFWGYEWNAPMLPFTGLLNGHGIDKWYEKYYKCAGRPVKCRTNADCNIPRLDGERDLLWCDTRTNRCRAKVRYGGDCTGLPNDACLSPDVSVCGIPGIIICKDNTCQCGPFKG